MLLFRSGEKEEDALDSIMWCSMVHLVVLEYKTTGKTTNKPEVKVSRFLGT